MACFVGHLRVGSRRRNTDAEAISSALPVPAQCHGSHLVSIDTLIVATCIGVYHIMQALPHDARERLRFWEHLA